MARGVGVDIRQRGSGNIGATNVFRSAGWGPAAATLVGDVLKGYLAVWVGSGAGPGVEWAAVSAVLAVVGNCWSAFLGGSGGKGVATGLGAFLRVTPWAILPAAVVWAALVASFRLVSLASLCAVLGLPLAIFVLGYGLPLTAAGFVVAVIVIGRHHANIGRLLAGSERRFGERDVGSAVSTGSRASEPGTPR